MVTITAQEKDTTVNGVNLRYLDWGTAGKMPLVCLHGFTEQVHIWDEFAEAMAPHYHVLTVDQRGHGESQWASTGYARDQFVEDVAAFVDALNLSRFVLAGLSMGGWVSLLYTAQHPDRVERIILVDIAPEASPAFKADIKNMPTIPMEFSGFEAAVDWMRQGDPWVSDAGLRKNAENKLRETGDGKWTWKADPSLFNFEVMLPDLTDQGLIGRYWKALETITCPILEVRGAESNLISDDIIQRMKQVGKDFTSVDVPGAGHVVTVDRPDEFIQVTRSFLGVMA